MKHAVQVGLALCVLDCAAHFTKNPLLVTLNDIAKKKRKTDSELNLAFGVALQLVALKPDIPALLIVAASKEE